MPQEDDPNVQLSPEEFLAKVKTNAKGKVILALEEKGFGVALFRDGSTLKKEARTLDEFVDLSKEASVLWIDYVVDDFKTDLQKLTTLGFSDGLLSVLSKEIENGYEDLDTELGIVMPAIDVSGFDVSIRPLMVLIRNNLIISLHTTKTTRFFRLRRYAETFMRKIKPTIPRKDKLTSILIRILGENNSRNFDHLREIEENADKVSEQLSDPKSPRAIIGPRIHEMKHALIVYLTGLWECLDVINALRYGDPELLSDDPKLISRIAALAAEINTHIGLAEHLSEVLASGLEVVQSIYNNQLQILNNKLALLVAHLTIIGTAVLVPNTLGTILANPVYGLTIQDQGWFTALLVGSTILATAISYIWVRKMGLLPEKTE